MYIYFYQVSDAPNVVNKTIGNAVYTVSDARFITDCDILSPTLIMTYSSTISTANYVYIPEFGRYYFITGMTVMSGKRVAVSCSVDVLYTYKSSIVSCRGTVLRAENPTNAMMHDNKYPLIADTNVYSWLFPQTPWSADNGYNYLITTCGGVDSGS